MAHFITEDCIGCTLCAKSCPISAISGSLKERHVIDKTRCIDCGVCGDICAKQAVRDENGNTCEKKAPDDRLIPVIKEEICSGCWICVETCWKEALSLSAPAFHGDIRIHSVLSAPKACVGCGMCAKACPIHAISMKKRSEVPAEKGGAA